MRAGSWRSAIALAVLLAFSIQSFLVQTHLHAPQWALGFAASDGVSAPVDKTPLNADACLLCQEFTHSGHFLTPAAAAVLPPSAVVSLLPLTLAVHLTAKPASHAWHGRAPPLH